MNGATADFATPASPAQPFPARRPDPHPELIAPGSSLYLMLSDATMALYPLQAFLLPLLHPATADSTARNDHALSDTAHAGVLINRVLGTLEMVGAVVYGGSEAQDAARAVRDLHRDLGGTVNGESYHPWTREIWTWNWAAITAGVMGVYGAIRGWPSEGFRDEAYLGMVEIGRSFGVLGMPEDHAEFAAIWPAERDRVAVTDSFALAKVAASLTASGMTPPPRLRFLPEPLWAILTWPVRHLYRVSVCAAVTPEHRRAIGLPTGWRDDVYLAVHRAAWRLVPRRATHRAGVLYFAARLRWGTPLWRTRFSEQSLARRRLHER